MARVYLRRIRGGVIRPVSPWGDVGAVEVVAYQHDYLHCVACGHRLWHGTTTSGAPVLVCCECRRFVDQRRVA